jgi:mono/diheme cytochrome c family protein
MRVYLYFVFIGLALVIMLSACKHDPYPAPVVSVIPSDSISTGIKPCHPDSVYFKRDILPLLSSNCAYSGCHIGSNPPKGVLLDSYNAVMNTADIRPGNPSGSDLFEVITEGDPDKRMPPPPNQALSTDQIITIQTWILQGAKNLDCNTCDTTDVRYSIDIREIIDANCVNCHGPSVQNGGLNLSTHTALVDAILNRNLIERINSQTGFSPMPPNGNKILDCSLDKMNIWVQDGMPNN